MIKNSLHIQGAGGKTILVVGSLHGHELIGKRVIEELRTFSFSGGTLVTLIANTRAIEERVRFIDQDLNRSFPGKKDGNYEQRLAYEIDSLLKKADVVIDIHSTTVGLASSVILTKVNKPIRKILSFINPKRVIVMQKSVGKTSLTGNCKAGISLEYGADTSERAYKENIIDILSILSGFGISTERKVYKKKTTETEYFESLGTLSRRPGFKLNKEIKNFLLVKKGNVIGVKGIEKQKAEFDFYPFLFREKSYKDIWGFMAKKVKEI